MECQGSLELHHFFGIAANSYRQNMVLRFSRSIEWLFPPPKELFMLQAQSTELGWHPDLPDWRDLTLNADKVLSLFRILAPLESRPARVDWREYCCEVDSETEIASSTRACVALLEQCERRVAGQGIELSKQFVRRSAARLAES